MKKSWTAKDDFMLRNDLTEANFQYLMLRKFLGLNTLGEVQMPNGEKKIIKR